MVEEARVTKSYRPRVVDGELLERLSSLGAVLIEGPKACGKTETARRVARSEVRLDVDAGARALVTTSPETLFAQPTPILFDEWQMTPELWNLVRREVDDRWPERNQFVLTGSATPQPSSRRHSGSGRFSTMRMRPMSLFETGHSTGAVSIGALFDGASPAALDPGITVPHLIELIVIGGWPTLLDAATTDAQRWLRDYLTNLVEVDVQALDGRRDPRNVRRLLTALGRAVGTDTTVQTLANDVGGADGPADWHTVRAYLDALDRLMVVEDVPAWAPHMRSTTPLRKSAKRYMTDPSIAVAALAVGPDQLLNDLNATGFHFEAMVVRDLRVYVQRIGGVLHHWRDNNGHEVDVIISLDDGRWGAFEVKMNPDDTAAAAQSLRLFVDKVDLGRVGPPSFIGVITTRSSAYRRPDGVLVVPIATLGP